MIKSFQIINEKCGCLYLARNIVAKKIRSFVGNSRKTALRGKLAKCEEY